MDLIGGLERTLHGQVKPSTDMHTHIHTVFFVDRS